MLANGYSANTRSSVVLNSRDRFTVLGDSTRCTFTHTTGTLPMVSISSRINVAYSRRFDKKYTSLVPNATITAVGRRPPDTNFL